MRVDGHSALPARRADVLAAAASAAPAARAAGRLSRAYQPDAESVTLERNRSVHLAQQPSISRSACAAAASGQDPSQACRRPAQRRSAGRRGSQWSRLGSRCCPECDDCHKVNFVHMVPDELYPAAYEPRPAEPSGPWQLARVSGMVRSRWRRSGRLIRAGRPPRTARPESGITM